MKFTLADAASINGKITQGESSMDWISGEDQEHFSRLRQMHDTVVMGRVTYEQARPNPEPGKLRVVLTHNPDRFASKVVPGQLEFIDASPEELAKQLKNRGRQKVLVAGGSTVTRDFLRAGLADELYLTIEPLIIGTGKPLVTKGEFATNLKLLSVKKLNDRGTLLAHYAIEK